MSVHFSSKIDQWTTPQAFFDEINKEFNFQLDVCADEHNAKCKRYLSQNGLELPWSVCNWMNLPYGREIGKWVKKASENPVTVCLLPARTDTRWFHDYIYKKENVTVRFLKGRLKFGDAKNSAQFPLMLVIFDNDLF